MRLGKLMSFFMGLYVKGCCSYKILKLCGVFFLKGLEISLVVYCCFFMGLVSFFLDLKER